MDHTFESQIGAATVRTTQANFPEYEQNLAETCKAMFTDGQNYIDTQIAADRNLNQRYYDAEDLGNEVEGRSTFVVPVVRDEINKVLPNLLRIFTASDDVIKFTPRRAADTQMADYATKFCNYSLMKRNNGFQVLKTAIHESLLKRIGFLKVWWDVSTKIVQENYTGLTQIQVAYLKGEPDLEIVSQTPCKYSDAPVPTYDVTMKRTFKKGAIKVQAIPTEEIVVWRRAKHWHDTPYIAHRRLATVSELVALGYDYEEMLNFTQQDNQIGINGNLEEVQRNPYSYPQWVQSIPAFALSLCCVNKCSLASFF